MPSTLLIPIDLAHESSWRQALPQAFALASATGADVTIMTVVPEILGGLDWRYSIRGETGGSEELDIDALLRDARERLEQIGREHSPGGAEFDVIARYGTVYEEILNVADELEATQIVMAAHRPSLSDYLIGPNTARVVRHATCSVQVVRG
ncbi:MAG: universal stress protein [Pseudomonadota bacterium]